eukprot:s4544_g3.t2
MNRIFASCQQGTQGSMHRMLFEFRCVGSTEVLQHGRTSLQICTHCRFFLVVRDIRHLQKFACARCLLEPLRHRSRFIQVHVAASAQSCIVS